MFTPTPMLPTHASPEMVGDPFSSAFAGLICMIGLCLLGFGYLVFVNLKDD